MGEKAAFLVFYVYLCQPYAINEKTMKKLLIIGIVLLVAIIMIITRPAKTAHQEAMMEAVKEFVNDEADSLKLGDNVLTQLGKGIVNKTVEKALHAKLEMHDYLLFNTTYVKLNGEEQFLSLGLLGHVFTFDSEMLHEKLQEAADEKAAAKKADRELKQLEKEKKQREKELKKERKRQQKDSARIAKKQAKELKRLEKELRREQKRNEE